MSLASEGRAWGSALLGFVYMYRVGRKKRSQL